VLPVGPTAPSIRRKIMNEVTTTAPDPATVVDKVRALLPEISARADEIEQARSVPQDLTEQLRSAGVYRRYVPRSHGGDEMWPDQGLTVIEELARADASVAWVAAVGSEGRASTRTCRRTPTTTSSRAARMSSTRA
jgi:alkylation response protein AidB-like acyl-CoA dehydrogenase